MDFLLDCAERVQESVFSSVASLLNLEVDVIFFDTTSTYFEIDVEDPTTTRTATATRTARRRGRRRRRRRQQGVAAAARALQGPSARPAAGRDRPRRHPRGDTPCDHHVLPARHRQRRWDALAAERGWVVKPDGDYWRRSCRRPSRSNHPPGRDPAARRRWIPGRLRRRRRRAGGRHRRRPRRRGGGDRQGPRLRAVGGRAAGPTCSCWRPTSTPSTPAGARPTSARSIAPLPRGCARRRSPVARWGRRSRPSAASSRRPGDAPRSGGSRRSQS